MSGLLAFAAGLGAGSVARMHRNEDLERQERLDTMREQEHALRMRQMEGVVSDQEQERQNRAEARASIADAVDGSVVDAPSGRQFFKSRDEAGAASGNAAIEAEMSNELRDLKQQEAASGSRALQDGGRTSDLVQPSSPAAAAAFHDGKKPRIGAAGISAAALSTPEAKYERYAAILEKQDPVKAMEFRNTAAEYKTRREALNTQALYDAGAKMFSGGNLAGGAKLLGGALGADAAVEEDGKGGGVIRFKRGDQPLGGFSFKSKDELLQGFRDTLYPDEKRKRLADLQDKRTPVAPQTDIVDGNGRMVYKNNSLTAAQLRALGAGGAGSSWRMDEQDKIRLNESIKNVQAANRAVQEALLEAQKTGMGEREQAAKVEAVQNAKREQTAAKIEHLRTRIVLGDVTPADMAEQILGAAKNPDEVVASLNQIRGAVGQRFTDQVGAIAQTSDIWRSWHQAAPESDTTPASQDALANTRLTSKAAPPASAGYVPVPGSPAALAVEQRKKSAAEAQARRSHEAETRAASEKAAATLGEAVRRQLSARDPAERARIARQIQASGEFSRLDRSTQELVFRAVNGR